MILRSLSGNFISRIDINSTVTSNSLTELYVSLLVLEFFLFVMKVVSHLYLIPNRDLSFNSITLIATAAFDGVSKLQYLSVT
jgi:hypothetical protein